MAYFSTSLLFWLFLASARLAGIDVIYLSIYLYCRKAYCVGCVAGKVQNSLSLALVSILFSLYTAVDNAHVVGAII